VPAGAAAAGRLPISSPAALMAAAATPAGPSGSVGLERTGHRRRARSPAERKPECRPAHPGNDRQADGGHRQTQSPAARRQRLARCDPASRRSRHPRPRAGRAE